jgi:hypothetical protein
MAPRKKSTTTSKKSASKRRNVAKGKRAAAPTINPQPIVLPTVPGGYTQTEGTDRCPVEGCDVTFSSRNNLRAITIHLNAIVKKGRAYYVLRRRGGGFWDAHNDYYQDKQEQRGKYNVIL